MTQGSALFRLTVGYSPVNSNGCEDVWHTETLECFPLLSKSYWEDFYHQRERGIKGERGEESNVLKLRSVKEITLSSHRGEEFMVNRPLYGLDRQNKYVGDNKTLHFFKVCALMRFV